MQEYLPNYTSKMFLIYCIHIVMWYIVISYENFYQNQTLVVLELVKILVKFVNRQHRLHSFKMAVV